GAAVNSAGRSAASPSRRARSASSSSPYIAPVASAATICAPLPLVASLKPSRSPCPVTSTSTRALAPLSAASSRAFPNATGSSAAAASDHHSAKHGTSAKRRAVHPTGASSFDPTLGPTRRSRRAYAAHARRSRYARGPFVFGREAMSMYEEDLVRPLRQELTK